MKLFLIFLFTAFLLLSCGEDGKTGSDGTSSSLLKISQEPEGTEKCGGFGGTRIDAGTDEDSNGILDENEIDSTQFICNGSDGGNGENGSNGGSNIIKITDEPENTENCDGKGGKKIESGIDDNSDGVLQEEESDNVKFVCNEAGLAIYYGDFYISSTADMEYLSAYDVVVGSIYVDYKVYDLSTGLPVNGLSFSNLKGVSESFYFGEGNALYRKNKTQDQETLQSLDFPVLEYVHGALYISNMNSLESVNFPQLREVGISYIGNKMSYDAMRGLFVEDNPLLKSLALPELEKGSIYIDENDSMESIDLSGIKNAETSVIQISSLPLLDSLNLSNLENVLMLYLNSLPKLESLNLSKITLAKSLSINLKKMPMLSELNLSNLEEIYSLKFYDDFNFSELSFPGLKKINGYFHLSSLPFTSLTLPELISVKGDFKIENVAVSDLYLPKLADIKTIDIESCSDLKSISFPEASSVGSVYVSSNPLLESISFPKLFSIAENSFTVNNNPSLSECRILPVLINVRESLSSWSVSGNKACNYYEYNNPLSSEHYTYKTNITGFMNSSDWSVSEKFIIPLNDTNVTYPHLLRGRDASPAAGDFRISADGVNNTVTASVYSGTAWVTLTGTDAAVKPGLITSLVLSYDATALTLDLYVNGTKTDSETLAVINDSENSNYLYIAASNEAGYYVKHTPYGLLHIELLSKALTENEIKGYAAAVENFFPSENSFMEINVTGNTLLEDYPFLGTSGSPVKDSVLNVLN